MIAAGEKNERGGIKLFFSALFFAINTSKFSCTTTTMAASTNKTAFRMRNA
jgi:hypothetical protein